MARSKLEARLDKALKELYPHDRIICDWPIKLGKGKTLYVDRVIRRARLAFEADGRQHEEFVQWMHRDADGFKSHKERDRAKESWLHANGYTLVRIAYNENISAASVRAKILEALTGD